MPHSLMSQTDLPADSTALSTGWQETRAVSLKLLAAGGISSFLTPVANLSLLVQKRKMMTTITRVFLATGPGEVNKTTAVATTYTSPELLLEVMNNILVATALRDEVLAMIERLEAQAYLEDCLDNKQFTGLVVDVKVNSDIKCVNHGRHLCVEQLGDRLGLLPIGYEGWMLEKPNYVILDKDVTVLAVEDGDNEWEGAFDALTKHITELENWIACKAQPKDDEDHPQGLMTSYPRTQRERERSVQEAQGDLLCANHVYRLLVACE